MKKQLKKLNLHKETLRVLETPELRYLGGGAPTDLCTTFAASCATECPKCNTDFC